MYVCMYIYNISQYIGIGKRQKCSNKGGVGEGEDGEERDAGM